MIRTAVREDVPAILAIYAPYIEHTTITFETEVPTLRAFQARFEGIAAAFPWIVWEESGRILGYAYGDRAFSRAAYAWDADMSIYLAEENRGRGIGTRLYGCLEQLLKEQGYVNLYAVITGENAPSIRFHERRGYERLGTLKQSGWKFGRWLDVDWYGLRLRADAPGDPPAPYAETKRAREIMAMWSRNSEAEK